MRVPIVVWKTMRHLVAVSTSAFLLVVVMALLPVGLGSGVLLGVIGMVGLLAGGKGEGLAVRVATRSGAATDAELQVLWTVPELEGQRVLVCRRPAGSAAPVAMTGPFTVVSAALVEALQQGWVRVQEVTALVVHARAHHRVAASSRGEVAVAVVEMPWRPVLRVFRWVGRAVAWMPLGSLAWRLRGVVALVCLVQSAVQGRTWAGVLGAGVIALTYLVPAGGRFVEARATEVGDAAVVAAGLGDVLVDVLKRGGQPLSLRRLQRLQVSLRSEPRR